MQIRRDYKFKKSNIYRLDKSRLPLIESLRSLFKLIVSVTVIQRTIIMPYGIVLCGCIFIERTVMIKKIPAKYVNFVMPLILSLFMTFIVSGIATFKNLGISYNSLYAWFSAWVTSFPIAFPVLLVVLPFVKRIVMLIVETPSNR